MAQRITAWIDFTNDRYVDQIAKYFGFRAKFVDRLLNYRKIIVQIRAVVVSNLAGSNGFIRQKRVQLLLGEGDIAFHVSWRLARANRMRVVASRAWSVPKPFKEYRLWPRK